MRVRLRSNHSVKGYTGELNTHALFEIIVIYDEGDSSSEFPSHYDVELRDGVWMPFTEAWKRDLIELDDNAHRIWLVDTTTKTD